MEGVNETLQVAEGISEYGIMVIICAVFLVMSSALMVACFRWFKSVIGDVLGDYSGKLDEMNSHMEKTTHLMERVAEGLIPETRLRVETLSGVFFDLSVEKVCRMIKRVREENHIANRQATSAKVLTLLHNLYEERASQFENFRYRGKRLSEYCNPEWIDMVAYVVEKELYNESGQNNRRAYTNVKAVYDNIKLDFFHRMNK